MKWFKHDSDAHSDAKLKRVRIKYGLEGYGLYWYCLELIAKDVSETKLTFELEHDSEIIAHDTGIHYERVQEMMTYMVELNLFENETGVLTCLKMAKRLDQSMTSNPRMRKLISKTKENHDSIMTGSGLNHDKVMQDKIRLDKNRLDKNKGGKPPKEVSPSAQSIPFDIFWNRYPRKTNKQKAEAAWKKLNPSDDLLNKIIENIDRRLLLDEWSRDRKDFIPHASTFLNGRRWEDEVVPKTGGSNGYQQTNQPGNKPRSPADRFRAIRAAEQRSDGSVVGEDAGELRPQVGRVVRDDADGRLAYIASGNNSPDD